MGGLQSGRLLHVAIGLLRLLLPCLQVQVSKEEYEAAKAKDPEFYRTADSLQYGQAPELPKENVDRMVAELASK